VVFLNNGAKLILSVSEKTRISKIREKKKEEELREVYLIGAYFCFGFLAWGTKARQRTERKIVKIKQKNK